ncbi:MAG TPA: fimbria/pilus periplasmic chaperone [Dyella sp.]|uniref:fimbrial biogenesis chaperone n=1 Tax=Dyella sp. TaxID=1869338 RepID=UPI002BAA17B9|nr:fimbria/pilus periplasmic chaperone [Dyella sp.]HTV87243.1 fimbria/pilus periplasmic chaperone [Dyella sp.]
MKPFLRHMASAAFLMAVALQAHAGVVISTTRVVYQANDKEETVKLNNEGTLPLLVQAWLDSGDINASPAQIAVPFTLTPPMFRMDPGKGQALRLRYTGEPLPKDKETLFWLNVLEVPPKDKTTADTNALRMAIRTRIKVMFRPKGLPGSAKDAPGALTWNVVREGDGYALKASNASPYFVNLATVALSVAGKTLDAGQGYVAPSGVALFPVKDLSSAPGASADVQYVSIDDYGTKTENKKSATVGQ